MNHIKRFNESEDFTEAGNKFYLCFWVGDGSDNESNNVYYSHIVIAENKDEALDKYIQSGHHFAQGDKSLYGVIEMKNIIK